MTINYTCDRCFRIFTDELTSIDWHLQDSTPKGETVLRGGKLDYGGLIHLCTKCMNALEKMDHDFANFERHLIKYLFKLRK